MAKNKNSNGASVNLASTYDITNKLESRVALQELFDKCVVAKDFATARLILQDIASLR